MWVDKLGEEVLLFFIYELIGDDSVSADMWLKKKEKKREKKVDREALSNSVMHERQNIAYPAL